VTSKPIKVVLLSETFTEGMGYLENLLPKYLGRLGVESHVVATDLPANYRLEQFSETYGQFAKTLEPNTVLPNGDFTLHVLGHRKIAAHMRMLGLRQKLTLLRPDVVQTMSAVGWIPLDAALLKPLLGYRLFTGCHYHASVFSLASKHVRRFSKERWECLITRALPGRFVGLFSDKCYAIAPDCAEIAVRFFGVPEDQVSISPLGVDTELFYPVTSETERNRRVGLRRRLGYSDSDIVCVYSGRLSEDKNPLLLARAVEQLAKSGRPYRGLFVGNGVQATPIKSLANCQIHPFVPVHELGAFFRASDIAVWPTQESMSMLDASACGIPIIANDTMSTTERIDGNGLTYHLNDVGDLIRALLQLGSVETRRTLGLSGARKMVHDFSWETVARRRLSDYERALGIADTLCSQSERNNLFGSAD
jgi:glycosyltransferase involved in cell wall biosynthesis